MSTYNIVSISGGKDSQAVMALAVLNKVPNLRFVFADTGHEHALTYQQIDYQDAWLSDHGHEPIRRIKADFSAEIERKRQRLLQFASGEKVSNGRWEPWEAEHARRVAELMKPTGNPFVDLCILKGRFPSTKARFCSEELKRNPIIEQVFIPLLDEGHEVISWQGVRADESLNRADLPERDEVGGGLWNYRPILKWTASDVFDFIEKAGMKPNPLYTMGCGRVGCMPCIHSRKDELRNIALRFPEEIERVAEMERLVSDASKRGMATFFSTSDGRGEGIEEVVQWSKTQRGGKLYDLFADQVESCSSIYGLCE